MTSPREVVEKLIKGLSGGAWDELAQLYAEDAVVEHPYAESGPSRIEGRAVLHERFMGAYVRPFELSAHNLVIRQTDDPEVVVVEYDYEVRMPKTGKGFRTANILVVRVRDGLIVHSRDFHDHRAFAAAVEAA
ncbi:ketosteroid isomerase-like protein [Kibdelosporangium banguiense]|uniref:Ketosteroid isomerase-like protein n=1 Tax=Kibdelosporangium banguiense TaxID=1365924 RepID=A0ABS4T6M8_9PSEU|nr:nuclear transport factor 2 family protein [Kibdelosporangium banguiense]MBP2320077.1 ketosteroid isomerase-like protein [Kibdelosporangium banguiense]